MAACAAARSANPDALARSVLGDVFLLERIFDCMGPLELSLMAQVCRLWRGVAASEAVWRSVWRREAPSLRSLEASVALPAGAGFRAAVRQLYESSTLVHKEWALDDFRLAVDITWRERPLFSGLLQLSAALVPAGGTYFAPAVCVFNSLDGTENALRFVRNMRELLPEEGEEEAGELYLSMIALRSDGAVATLAFQACENLCVGLGDTIDAAERHISVAWRNDFLDEPGRSHFYSPHVGAADFCWELRLGWRSGGCQFDGFNLAVLQLSREHGTHIRGDDVIRALTCTLKWTLPRPSFAAAPQVPCSATLEAADAGGADA
jgi:hypothetical protein